MRIRTVATVLLIAGILLLPAVAGGEDRYRNDPRDGEVPWAAIGYAVLCLALICAVAFKHAKRTHLD